MVGWKGCVLPTKQLMVFFVTDLNKCTAFTLKGTEFSSWVVCDTSAYLLGISRRNEPPYPGSEKIVLGF
jgi:hypothetical protein